MTFIEATNILILYHNNFKISYKINASASKDILIAYKYTTFYNNNTTLLILKKY